MTIKKASAALAGTIIVPLTATERKIRLDALDFPAGMTQGAKLKEAPSAGGGVLKEIAGKAGDAAFTLRTRTVKRDRSQEFTLVFESDNYVKLTAAFTVIATGAEIEITPPAAKVKRETSEYGAPLEDIISLEGGSAALKSMRIPGTFTLPDKPLDAGKYTDIQVLFNSHDGNYQNLPVRVPAVFTIKKAAVNSVAPDEPLAQYIMIYANDPANTSAEGLRNLVAARAGSYTGCYGGGTVALKPSWRAVSAAKPYHFDPKGKAENVWYPYTAALTVGKDSDARNFHISMEPPKAYLRVIPVKAAQTLSPDSAVLTAASLKALTDENLTAALGLPEKAGVIYTPMEELPTAGFEETSDEYAITGWRMNGRPLTLKALRAVSGGSAEITLTPFYASGTIPAWAKATDPPQFKLTLTDRPPAA